MFLHTFVPDPVLVQFGPITIYYYGLIIVSGILVSTVFTLKLAQKYQISQDKMIDLLFWLIIFGLLGSRLYHVFLELPYYLSDPLAVIKVWNGGLAIHGGLLAGLIVLCLFGKKNKINFWHLSAVIAPGLALAQAIGRWGNYFNQELFGLPTDLPWGIPIELHNRLAAYYQYDFFHPTFLYESIGNFMIFLALYLSHRHIIKNNFNPRTDSPIFALQALGYLIMYSVLRFSTEFIRLDPTPQIWIFRLPQVASLLIIIVSGIYLAKAWANLKAS